ncbi:hypothetical protein L195_g028631 [Trifolium pratense]|uniref:Uncharacterized protein n=1 Tax=Trifolium pratense TaxID=57577 RepID=A0A2K3L2K3_TRIPR|nr:hypothetical protein L195_g028631 [Trifolium pratense]
MVRNSHIECEVDESNKGDSIVCEKGTCKPAPSAKKKHKSGRKKEDMTRDGTLKEKDVSVVVPVQHDVVVLILANSSENADKEIIKETEVLKEHIRTLKVTITTLRMMVMLCQWRRLQNSNLL